MEEVMSNLKNTFLYFLRTKGINKLPKTLKNKIIFFRNSYLKLRKSSDIPAEIGRRKSLSIFEVQQLSQPLTPYPFSKVPENNYYGNALALGSICDTTNCYNTVIEHGLFFGSYVPEDYKSYDTILTFSEYRKKIIRNKYPNKEVIVTGPYIEYIAPLTLNEKDKQLIIDFNKILLVIPAHSINSVHVDFNSKKMVEDIMSFKEQHSFDTVLVCLYWKDVLLGADKYYKNLGIQTVTAGHIYDINFLARLKTIISLSSYVLTNTVGTHIGYSICLNKPLQIIKDVSLTYIEGNNNIAAKNELELRKNQDKETYDAAIREIENEFLIYNNGISSKQSQCINKFWGKKVH